MENNYIFPVDWYISGRLNKWQTSSYSHLTLFCIFCVNTLILWLTMLPSLNVKLYVEAKHSYWCITYRIKSDLQMKELRRSWKKHYYTQRYFLFFYCKKEKDHVGRIRNLTNFCEYITCISSYVRKNFKWIFMQFHYWFIWYPL